MAVFPHQKITGIGKVIILLRQGAVVTTAVKKFSTETLGATLKTVNLPDQPAPDWSIPPTLSVKSQLLRHTQHRTLVVVARSARQGESLMQVYVYQYCADG